MRLTAQQQCVHQVLQCAAADYCSETLSDYFTVHYVYLCLSALSACMHQIGRTVVAQSRQETIMVLMMI